MLTVSLLAASATGLHRSCCSIARATAFCAKVLDFVQHARSKGIMAVVAVTKPFAFEGARKLQAADKLIADLKSDADMVRPDLSRTCCAYGAAAR